MCCPRPVSRRILSAMRLTIWRPWKADARALDVRCWSGRGRTSCNTSSAPTVGFACLVPDTNCQANPVPRHLDPETVGQSGEVLHRISEDFKRQAERPRGRHGIGGYSVSPGISTR